MQTNSYWLQNLLILPIVGISLFGSFNISGSLVRQLKLITKTMKKKSATIYPYSKRDVQFFRYASLLKEVQPLFAVIPPGWGLYGHDVTDIDGGQPAGVKITEDLEQALQNSELLIITSFDNYAG